jgi:hypothetical protein
LRQATRDATRRLDRSKISGSPVEPPVVNDLRFFAISERSASRFCRTSAFLNQWQEGEIRHIADVGRSQPGL